MTCIYQWREGNGGEEKGGKEGRRGGRLNRRGAPFFGGRRHSKLAPGSLISLLEVKGRGHAS